MGVAYLWAVGSCDARGRRKLRPIPDEQGVRGRHFGAADEHVAIELPFGIAPRTHPFRTTAYCVSNWRQGELAQRRSPEDAAITLPRRPPRLEKWDLLLEFFDGIATAEQVVAAKADHMHEGRRCSGPGRVDSPSALLKLDNEFKAGRVVALARSVVCVYAASCVRVSGAWLPG